MRETSRGAYRVSSYVLANTIVFLPFLFMVSILFASPVYWLVGLRRDNIDGFLYFTLVVWMVLLMSNSFVACFSALVPNFIMGNSVIAGLMGSIKSVPLDRVLIPSLSLSLLLILFSIFASLSRENDDGHEGKSKVGKPSRSGVFSFYPIYISLLLFYFFRFCFDGFIIIYRFIYNMIH